MNMKRILAVLAIFALVGVGTISTASGSHGRRGAEISPLATFGTLGSGSTLSRTERSTSRTATWAASCASIRGRVPSRRTPKASPEDRAHRRRHGRRLLRPYRLRPRDPCRHRRGRHATVGIYRLNNDGSFTVIADIGAWALDNPPPPGTFFIPTGVQYAIQAYWGGVPGHRRAPQPGAQGDVGRSHQRADRVRQRRSDRTRSARDQGLHGPSRTRAPRAGGREGRELPHLVAGGPTGRPGRPHDRRRRARAGLGALCTLTRRVGPRRGGLARR